MIRAVKGHGERANALPKITIKALCHVSLFPWRIGTIAEATLVPLHLEHDRPIPGGHPT